MNSNTNTVPNNSTTTSGTGIGNRFRGAAEVIHGAGEGLRGTFLGAVDTVMKNGATHNDEIARQGRLEVERGMENIKGQTAANTSAYGNAAGNNTAYSTPYAASGATHAPGFGAGSTSGGALHPNHHREDAVAGIPQNELRDVQSHAAQSYSQSQEPQGDGVNPVAASHGVGFANDNTANANTYGPAGVTGQNMSDYPSQGADPVAKNKQFDPADDAPALDQGSGGHGMGTRGLDGRGGLN